MGTLVIRDLDDEVKARLRVRAAEHGRSMEAEAREILATTVSPTRPRARLGSHIRDRFRTVGPAGLPVPARSDPAGDVTFPD
ncbi:hypothetical protein SAMN05443575_0366 [Jatrophihabitans endophyticus]|uniref:Antitoxin FitA-like ribbon-helix-helix domain-containing protein n=1 Tax=Jatrophihabitans endophyticus TaxID=1206085 RepID=A0A1M5CV33_9ACTN|nr:hypothetical protein [Jatrophihabitans endophyticus]SHF58620.1 hypothetical protein SAMN05443575_0366 [Jatrophihabitans endophyticus]